MEVRIKDNNGYVDADWTIEDGIMVVSPKVEKFEPKDGDVVFQSGPLDYVFVYKEAMTYEAYYYVAISLDDLALHHPDGGHIGYIDTLRPATEGEKKKLFDKLAEKGYEFDFEKKELVKLRWKPKLHERYFAPWINMGERVYFFRDNLEWENDSIDKELYEKGWVFQTKEECEAFCKKLNDVINQVKP